MLRCGRGGERRISHESIKNNLICERCEKLFYSSFDICLPSRASLSSWEDGQRLRLHLGVFVVHFSLLLFQFSVSWLARDDEDFRERLRSVEIRNVSSRLEARWAQNWKQKHDFCESAGQSTEEIRLLEIRWLQDFAIFIQFHNRTKSPNHFCKLLTTSFTSELFWIV